MAESEKKSSNFTVTDRRAFDTSGERKAEAAQTAGEQPAPPAAPAKPAETAPPARTRDPARTLPPADFATLVLSLGSSAMMYLGESDGPEGQKLQRNLPMAKHAIDMLNVLEEKTKGNLTSEEQQILESLLFDLRLHYVEVLKAAPSGG
jgi:hypothetical protein